MAVGAWQIYNTFKEFMGDGTIDLDTDAFRITLHTSASNAATVTLSVFTSVNNEVASAGGYVTSGKTLSATTWATGASASEMRFDSTAVFWSAGGANIVNVKYAVAWQSAGKLVAFSQLSTGQFTVTDGNRLTITPSANGIFELN